MDSLVFEYGGDPSRPTLRTEHCLRYESLDSLKADGTGREKINKYPTRRPFAGCLCDICMRCAEYLTIKRASPTTALIVVCSSLLCLDALVFEKT